MQRITPADPAWHTTFPHLVAPREGEGLTGLLLRCDEANLWSASGTLSYLLDSTSTKKLAQGVRQLEWKHLETLASALALPLPVIVATTFGEWLLRERWHRSASPALMSGNRNASKDLSFQPISSPTDWLSRKETGIAHFVALFGRGYVQRSRSTCFSCNLMSPL
jgi:hypothetical protein